MRPVTKRITDTQLLAWMNKRPEKASEIPDGSVPGLTIRVGPRIALGQAATADGLLVEGLAKVSLKTT